MVLFRITFCQEDRDFICFRIYCQKFHSYIHTTDKNLIFKLDLYFINIINRNESSFPQNRRAFVDLQNAYELLSNDLLNFLLHQLGNYKTEKDKQIEVLCHIHISCAALNLFSICNSCSTLDTKIVVLKNVTNINVFVQIYQLIILIAFTNII